jgi:polysaccharide deacetylase family protein (PEP-CTERM system associated)
MISPFHLLTVDVEDWPQSTLDHSLPIGTRVLANTRAILELLEDAKVRATFFVLGKVAETHPQLAREIISQGHEVGTHGYSHEAVEKMPLARFKEELHRSVDLLRQQTGEPVIGHRAADFSISKNSLHLLECLINEGLVYDSSIFPIRHPRYGVPEAWRRPHYVRCRSGQLLIEFPLPTIRIAGFAFPSAGGGYFRLFPFWWTRLALQALEREGAPATCYFHPYETDCAELSEINYRIPVVLRLSQGANRKSVIRKIRKLLSSFRFVTMSVASDFLGAQLNIGIDLTKSPALYEPING